MGFAWHAAFIPRDDDRLYIPRERLALACRYARVVGESEFLVMVHEKVVQGPRPYNVLRNPTAYVLQRAVDIRPYTCGRVYFMLC